ncbi:hypothetical protein AOLI_G00096090 [Acnodon oligacanthus]
MRQHDDPSLSLLPGHLTAIAARTIKALPLIWLLPLPSELEAGRDDRRDTREGSELEMSGVGREEKRRDAWLMSVQSG